MEFAKLLDHSKSPATILVERETTELPLVKLTFPGGEMRFVGVPRNKLTGRLSRFPITVSDTGYITGKRGQQFLVTGDDWTRCDEQAIKNTRNTIMQGVIAACSIEGLNVLPEHVKEASAMRVFEGLLPGFTVSRGTMTPEQIATARSVGVSYLALRACQEHGMVCVPHLVQLVSNFGKFDFSDGAWDDATETFALAMDAGTAEVLRSMSVRLAWKKPETTAAPEPDGNVRETEVVAETDGNVRESSKRKRPAASTGAAA